MKEINIVELTSPGCHNCAEFKKFWESKAADFPNVNFEEVSITEPAGQELALKRGIFASPGIIINGELFSTGGVNKSKFLEKLKELSI